MPVSNSYATTRNYGPDGGSVAGGDDGETCLLDAFLSAEDDPETGEKGDEDECAAKLMSTCERWKQSARLLWPGWAESHGMTYGDQFGAFSWDARGMWKSRTPVPEKKLTRIAIPHMNAIITDVASLQCQDELNMKCSPPSDSSAAASSCEAGDALVSWMWDEQNYDEINVTAREEAAVVGTCWIFPQWDPSIGATVDQVIGEEPVFGPPDPTTGIPTTLGTRPVMGRAPEGGFSDRIVSCFEGFPDPASRSEWDGEGFIIEEKLPIAALRRMYPKHKDVFTRDSSPGAADGTYWADRAKGVSPRGLSTYAGAAMAMQAERSKVITVFMRKCPEFPRGRWAVVAHGKLVFKGDNPVYPTEKEEKKGERHPSIHWPVFRIAHKVVKGSYWGQGIAPYLVDLQRKLNGVASKFLHMLKRTSHPVLVKPKRTTFTKTDEPDQQIEVGADIQPGSIYYLQAPTFPQELQYAERYTVEQMEALAGIHAGTRGASKTNDSGTKDRQLFQRDLGRLEIPKRRNDRQMGRIFSYKLQQWRRYATTARTIKVVGPNLTTAVMSLDMASVAPGTDVVVYPDLMMPKDPAGRMLHISTAIDRKIIDMSDPVQRAGAARLLGFPGGEKMFEESLSSDRRCAENEGQRMYRGEPCQIEFWHDHAQHIPAHYSEMNTDAWRAAATPAQDDAPDVLQRKAAMRKIWLDHVSMHQQALKKLKETEQAQANPPSESINFKDLPPDGQVQLAAKGGLQIAPPKQPGAAAPAPGPGQAAPPSPPTPQAPAGPPVQNARAA